MSPQAKEKKTVSERREYQREFRRRKKEDLRQRKLSVPGRNIRDNPDYEDIIEAIKEEQSAEVEEVSKHA